MTDLTLLGIAEAGRLMARGELTSTDLTEAFLKRIEAVDHKIASYITVTADMARNAARQADMEMKGGAAPRADARHPGRAQGHLRDRRRQDDRPLASQEGLCAGDRRRDGAAPEGCGRGHPGQARHARIRQRRDDAGPAVPGRAQSVEHRSTSPAARRAARARRSPRSSAWARWAPTPAARSAIRRATAPPPASSRPTGWSAAAASSRCRFSFDTAGPLAWTTEDCALMLDVLAGYDPNDQGSAKAAKVDYGAAGPPPDQGHAHRAGAQLVRGRGQRHARDEEGHRRSGARAEGPRRDGRGRRLPRHPRLSHLRPRRDHGRGACDPSPGGDRDAGEVRLHDAPALPARRVPHRRAVSLRVALPPPAHAWTRARRCAATTW